MSATGGVGRGAAPADAAEPPAPPEPGHYRRGLRLLRVSMRLEPRPFAASVAGALVYAGTTVAAAVVLGRVTDGVVVPSFQGRPTGNGGLALAVAAIVGVAVAKAAGIVFRRVGATIMQARLQARFRRTISERYQQLALSWHQRHPTGTLLSRANSDVETAFGLIAPLPLALGVVVMLLIAAGVIVATEPLLGLVGGLIIPAMALLNRWYSRRAVAYSRRAQERRGELSGIAHESFDGALVIKTLGLEAAETARFQTSSERLRDDLTRLGQLRALTDPTMEALPQLAVLLVLLVGSWRANAGAISAGEVVKVAYLFTLIAFPTRIIGYFLSELPRSAVGWERVQEVLAADEQLAAGAGDIAFSGPAARQELAEVSFRYGPARDPSVPGEEPAEGEVLRGVSLDLPAGRTVAVVGPTGAGKSTVVSLLARLVDPARGEVRLEGHDLRSLRPEVVAGSVAIVPQETFLFADTVRENITLGADIPDEEVREAAALAQADRFIAALPEGYDTVLGERGVTLSGGQRQRLALARALVRRPRVLVLDDATSSVDPRIEEEILLGLRSAALPSTVVLVAHRLATISLADEVVYLEQGRVKARGSHEDLLRSEPGYVRLLRSQDPEWAA